MAHDHRHDSRGGHVHPSLGATRDNWRNSDLPFFQKLKAAAGNTWIKLSRRQSCCGHPGEPGC